MPIFRIQPLAVAMAVCAVLFAPAAVLAKGGGSGGGSTTTVNAQNFPQTAYPGYVYRESFGFGVDWYTPQRPTGKGVMRDVSASRPLQGYWLEYPGSFATSWIAGATGQAWRFAGCGQYNPNEPTSLIQPASPGGTPSNACIQSQVINVGLNTHPSALVPFTPPTTKSYSVSIDAQPSQIGPGGYTAVGLTSSGALNANLAGNGSVWLVLYPGAVAADGTIGPLTYELRVTGTAGKPLASGQTVDLGWNSLSVGYNPATRTVYGSVNGAALGSFGISGTQANAIQTSRYAAIEGEGLADNFAITTP